jgi:hypothetical protein
MTNWLSFLFDERRIAKRIKQTRQSLLIALLWEAGLVHAWMETKMASFKS